MKKMMVLLGIGIILIAAALAYAATFGMPMQMTNRVVGTPGAVTIDDNGNGATAAASTLTTPVYWNYRYTCSDANGCDLTLGETSVMDGQQMCIENVGTNVVNLADTAGVSETAGSFAAGQYDMICYTYESDRWVERSRSNN